MFVLYCQKYPNKTIEQVQVLSSLKVKQLKEILSSIYNLPVNQMALVLKRTTSSGGRIPGQMMYTKLSNNNASLNFYELVDKDYVLCFDTVYKPREFQSRRDQSDYEAEKERRMFEFKRDQ